MSSSGVVRSAAAPSSPEYLVVEDHDGFGGRFARMLRKWGNPTLVKTLRDAAAAIYSQRWDAAFIDRGLPDGSGIQAISLLRAVSPFTPVILLTGGCDQADKERAWSLGARYLEKSDVSLAVIEDFLRSGAHHEKCLVEAAKRWREYTHACHEEPELTAQQKRSGLDRLSVREREIVTRKLRGEEDKEIAFDLGVADVTVRVLLGRASAKLECASRQELLEKAAALGANSPLDPKFTRRCSGGEPVSGSSCPGGFDISLATHPRKKHASGVRSSEVIRRTT